MEADLSDFALLIDQFQALARIMANLFRKDAPLPRQALSHDYLAPVKVVF